MAKIDTYFKDYSSYHRTVGNQRTHVLGIPLIVVALFSWAAHWVWIAPMGEGLPGSLLQLDFAEIVILGASAWYVYLDWKLGLPFMAILYAAYWVGRVMSPQMAAVFFILGWILQFLGHGIYEKNRPAFTKNFEHLLIGPIWVFSKILASLMRMDYPCALLKKRV